MIPLIPKRPFLSTTKSSSQTQMASFLYYLIPIPETTTIFLHYSHVPIGPFIGSTNEQ